MLNPCRLISVPANYFDTRQRGKGKGRDLNKREIKYLSNTSGDGCRYFTRVIVYVYFELKCKYSSQYLIKKGTFRHSHTFCYILKLQTVTQFVWAPCMRTEQISVCLIGDNLQNFRPT